MRSTRRSFLGACSAAAVAAGLPRVASATPRADLKWIDVADFPIEGRAFADRKAPFDRLPMRAEGVVRKEVWDLSRDSAGMCVRFATASPEIHVRYRLSSKSIALPHMPATGVSGCDLYGFDGSRWRWLAVTRPTSQDVEAKLIEEAPVDGKSLPYQLWLPLYNGVDSLQLGVLEGQEVTPLPPRPKDRKPVVCYGTSILHGACASRPGMAWPSIVSRALDREVHNFGFSGNGRMEQEVAQYLCEIDASAFVIDCLPNMTTELVKERTEPLVRQLRAARKDVPILLVEDRTFASAWFSAERREQHERRRGALRAAFARLQEAGVPDLHLLAGQGLLGDDDEGTTDGSHPNDLGMMRQADTVLAALRPLLAPR